MLRSCRRAFCAAIFAVCGREPIFSKTHTNEFCGIGFFAHKPAGPCAALHTGRWVYEKRAKTTPCGGDVRVTLGTSPRQPSLAALSPISYIAALAWCPTVCRGTDDCGEHHPSTVAPWRIRPGGAASGKTPFRRKGKPHVRRGVGNVGAWRFARPFQSHRGYLPVGEAFGLNLPGGPPLGALRRCLRGAFAPRSLLPTALWGIQEGKADVTRGETGERRTSCAATRALCPPPSNLVNSSALKHGRLALTGAR